MVTLLTRAERIQYEGYLRREEVNKAITAMKDEGLSLKEIVRRTGISRGTVRKIARGIQNDVFRVRESSLDAYLPILDALWIEGCHNGAELWRRLQARGFRGSLRVVTEWTPLGTAFPKTSMPFAMLSNSRGQAVRLKARSTN
nr:hypothetical protein [Rhizobium ruizarguesonis]